MGDDWLWDGQGTPDPETARLARALAPLRYEGAPPQLAQQRWRSPLVTTGLLLAAALLGWLMTSREQGVSWACGEECTLSVGQWLSTEDETVQLTVADVGTMTVSEHTKLRLLASSDEQHRLELARGHIHARVSAPPRLLVVDTPSASAVDLGCEYDLTVLEDGSSLLIVTTGEVSLEGKQVAYVPAEAAAMTWPGHGPGIPWFADSPVRYAEMLAAFDRGGHTGLLPEILAQSLPQDTLSLWHLLQRVRPADRGAVLDRITTLVPDTAMLPRSPLQSLDETALLDLRIALEEIWFDR